MVFNIQKNPIIFKREEFLYYLLQWNPLLFPNDDENNSLSSSVIPLKLKPPPLAYDSYEDYYQVQLSILVHEFWHELVNIYKTKNLESENSTLQIFPDHTQRFRHIRVNAKNYLLLRYSLYTEVDSSFNIKIFKPESLVKFTNPSTGKQQFGFIASYKSCVQNGKNVVKLEMMVKLVQFEPIPDSIVIEPVCEIDRYLILVDSLIKFRDVPLCEIILQPNIQDCQFECINADDFKSIATDKFNSKQLEATAKIIKTATVKNPKICLLSGPAGTGKSRIIAKSVVSLARQGRFLHTKIFVITFSNNALDSIISHVLAEEKEDKKINIIRIGIDERNREYVQYPSNSLEQQPRFRGATLGCKLMEEATIICTTLSSCSSKIFAAYEQRNERHPITPVCIIDEAPQMSELETSLKIPHSFNIETLILVGDSQQLSPKFHCKELKKNGLDQSLFTRIENIFSTVEKSPVLTLDTQYRMVPSIADWPNEFFYKGVLKNGISQNPTSIFEYKLLNHHYRESDDKLVNIGEAHLVVNIGHTLMTQINLEEIDSELTIGIIPFTIQQQNLILELSAKRTEEISPERKRKINISKVKIVDGFLGSEYDIIILSCVRSSFDEFVTLSDRLCLSLTRAKKSLIICGNFDNYSDDLMWKELINSAKRRKVVVDADWDEVIEPVALKPYLFLQY